MVKQIIVGKVVGTGLKGLGMVLKVSKQRIFVGAFESFFLRQEALLLLKFPVCTPTVDGNNPSPLRMPQKVGFIPVSRPFGASQVVPDFFHQAYLQGVFFFKSRDPKTFQPLILVNFNNLTEAFNNFGQ